MSVDVSPRGGYSAQARLSVDIAERINNGRINLWFAQRLNPPQNRLTSNPLEIFAGLGRYAGRGALEVDREKVRNLRANLAHWVLLWRRRGLIDDRVRNAALARIKEAGREEGRSLFTPSVLRLSEIIGAEPRSEPDEFLATDVSLSDRAIRPWGRIRELLEE